MIEKVIFDYIKQNADCPVYMEKPANAPAKFYLIEKTGGGGNRICRSTLAIQSYAGSMYEAAVLNEELKVIMDSALTLKEISSISLNSDYNYTDTSTKSYRYQAVFDIVHY